MSELRKRIDKLTLEQRGDALEAYLSNSRYNRAIEVLEKTIDDFMNYLEETNLVETLSDKDDKRFDRGKSIVKDLLDLVAELDKAKMSPLNVKQNKEIKKKSAVGNGILSLIDSHGKT